MSAVRRISLFFVRLRRNEGNFVALRFASPVHPGDVLATNGFSLGKEKAGFEADRTRNGDGVVSGGVAEVRF